MLKPLSPPVCTSTWERLTEMGWVGGPLEVATGERERRPLGAPVLVGVNARAPRSEGVGVGSREDLTGAISAASAEA